MDTGAAVAEGWQAEADAPGRCPVVDSAPVVTPRSELDARAKALGVSRQTAPAAPVKP
jgi:hypothetical protein